MNIIRRLSARRFCAVLALSVFLSAGSVQLFAGPIVANQVPTVKISIGDAVNAPSWTYAPPATDYRPATDENGGYELASPKVFDILDNQANVRIEELQFDPDPFVLNNILVTNNTGSTQIFSAFVGLPTSFPAPNFISGNVRTSVIDGGTDGATVATTVGQALYQAQIDSGTVATLQNDPFSVSAPPQGSNTASASFGPSVNGVPVTSDIGIQLRFTLTAGDTAAILSRFDVVAIPEPGSAALIGIGLALVTGVVGRRDR